MVELSPNLLNSNLDRLLLSITPFLINEDDTTLYYKINKNEFKPLFYLINSQLIEYSDYSKFSWTVLGKTILLSLHKGWI